MTDGVFSLFHSMKYSGDGLTRGGDARKEIS